MTARVSIFIQTLNEEQNLPRCLECFGWSDDIVVLDSYSEDGTERIARSFGARWVQHEYRGRAAHQNWAMQSIEFKHPWVYYSDADEVVPAALAEEIVAVTSDDARPEVAYQVRRRDYFMGRWVKHSSQYPVWFTRLFKPARIRWSRKANPVAHVDGPVGRLENDFLHCPFSKGIADWVERHNRYSTYEAEETLRSLSSGDLGPAELLSRDVSRRRQALKRLSFRLPFRPLLRFLYVYVLRGGFLDGLPGFHHSLLISFYEYLTVLKASELKRGGGL
ncbi:MAG: hypothetical protein AMK73_01480 [Planctomycetes bacterium SM23_32]|nr:MAG: hypothetical protein AMK73_01480 [Planctomycetes bacterium SM23_32]